ncbi:hypothetical protein EW026_g6618 [Hermanssonia centrifuga]|uniref:1-phosphatidylinositol-4-phosphate 5-kinase n=1 Tax=Hermanssonia centrifuga TaxID=98765 RepID=A0A4S4KAG8_9APHY|nr:hypothetical protein EW026_g6618 [Hermanssonia centrifuga]
MSASAAFNRRSSSPETLEESHRSSIASTSGTSFLTAPQSAASPSSSTHTLTARDADGLNPIHALAFSSSHKTHSQEMHIVKVTDDLVQIRTGPVPEPLMHKVGSTIVHAVPFHHSATRTGSPESSIGPPPPSPPASTEHGEELDPEDDEESSRIPYSPTIRPVTFEDPAHERQSSASTSRYVSKSSPRPPHSLSHRSSVETKSSFRTTTASTRITRSITSQSDGTADTPLSDDLPDGFLHASPQKYVRRNTIGSSMPFPSSSRPPPPRMMTMHSFQQSYDGETDGELGELATDIQQQAEQIRRERLSKKVKAAQEAEQNKAKHEAEKTLARTTSLVRAFSNRGDEGPLVGNLIGEGHVNYVLMYNMLTGIRIAVSRCQAKIRRTLSEEDFTAAHKYSFDIVGNELTPSAKYDFKFKDYAPWVFRELREDHFHLDPADYLLSLTAKYILSELGSPGKSGSFFYFSRDYRFIIKTIHHTEHKFLRRILPRYHAHVKANPHTLLSRFYGLHRVKLPHGRKIHFVIMNNLFPPHKDIHETYDLKGSTVGREYPEERAAVNPRAVLKDLNWINRGKTLELGPEKRALLTEQIRRDSELLKELRVMDYSLLVGIHNMARGNRDNVRRNTLKVFSPEVPMMKRKPTSIKGASSPEAIAMRRVVRESDVQALGSSTIALPEEDLGERQHFLFYQDDGGVRATSDSNYTMDTIYYLGIIDILTPYSNIKKLEHLWKGMQADRHKISPVPPAEYADRFFSFMKAVMRGGEGGMRFKSE